MLMRVHQDIVDTYPHVNEIYRWGVYEICCSAMCLLLCLMLVGAFAMGVLDLIGLNTLTNFHGFAGAG